jgi:hypothetical protein
VSEYNGWRRSSKVEDDEVMKISTTFLLLRSSDSPVAVFDTADSRGGRRVVRVGFACQPPNKPLELSAAGLSRPGAVLDPDRVRLTQPQP